MTGQTAGVTCLTSGRIGHPAGRSAGCDSPAVSDGPVSGTRSGMRCPCRQDRHTGGAGAFCGCGRRCGCPHTRSARRLVPGMSGACRAGDTATRPAGGPDCDSVSGWTMRRTGAVRVSSGRSGCGWCGARIGDCARPAGNRPGSRPDPLFCSRSSSCETTLCHKRWDSHAAAAPAGGTLLPDNDTTPHSCSLLLTMIVLYCFFDPTSPRTRSSIGVQLVTCCIGNMHMMVS